MEYGWPCAGHHLTSAALVRLEICLQVPGVFFFFFLSTPHKLRKYSKLSFSLSFFFLCFSLLSLLPMRQGLRLALLSQPPKLLGLQATRPVSHVGFVGCCHESPELPRLVRDQVLAWGHCAYPESSM